MGGVQGQVFTIINDEAYYYPELARGMIVDSENDEMGIDVAVYTGSTTGTTRNNRRCSAYAPITWQVDRKCHLISASSLTRCAPTCCRCAIICTTTLTHTGLASL